MWNVGGTLFEDIRVVPLTRAWRLAPVTAAPVTAVSLPSRDCVGVSLQVARRILPSPLAYPAAPPSWWNVPVSEGVTVHYPGVNVFTDKLFLASSLPRGHFCVRACVCVFLIYLTYMCHNFVKALRTQIKYEMDIRKQELELNMDSWNLPVEDSYLKFHLICIMWNRITQRKWQ